MSLAQPELPFTYDNVKIPKGSNALAKRFLESFEYSKSISAASSTIDTNTKNMVDATVKDENFIELSEVEKKNLNDFREPISEIPVFSLGKLEIPTVNVNTTSVEEHYEGPEIPVITIKDIDIYLVAYDNFLSRWFPNLEFNYTDPGKIEGHVNQLKNAIKLAFMDQYTNVRKTYLSLREKIFEDLNLGVSDKLCPSHRLLEENRLTPDIFNKMIDKSFEKLDNKQILDIAGHRGHGYFLLWKDPDTDSLYALPTIGTFGHFLPEPGFSLVKEFGWKYFRNTEIIGFQVGHLRKILIENQDGEWEDWDLKGPIYLEVSESEYDDHSINRIQINGAFFQGTIYSSIE